MMKQCWTKTPEKRPSFADLVETVSEYAEKIAGYLNINSYNPFTATYAEIADIDNQNKIVKSPEQVVEQIQSNISKSHPRSPKASPVSSPRHSPRASPRITPSVSPSHSPVTTPAYLGADDPSSPAAEVEIRVYSPDEGGFQLD